MPTVTAVNTFEQIGSVRLVEVANLTATYSNGPTNNGVGATLTFATGTLTIDSVLTALNDRILVAGQTLAYQNGVYYVSQAGATGVAAILTRVGDMQCIEQIRRGRFVPVGAGTLRGGSIYSIVEPLPAAIGAPLVSGANNIVFRGAIPA